VYLFTREIKRLVVALILVFISACSYFPKEPQDGAPPKPIDVSHVRDAQPAPVVRTRAGNAKVYTVLGKTYRTMESSAGYRERGVASWYGTKFHGRRTANGEVYDMLAMTAAHKTLPIPSYVRVTHVENGRSIVVRINDRGPFHDNRIIDLSYAAARKLGVDVTGTALVDVVDVTPSNNSPSSTISVKNSPVNNIPVNNSPIVAQHSQTVASNQLSSDKVNQQMSLNTKQNLESSRSTNQGFENSSVFLQVGAFQQVQAAHNLQSKVLSAAEVSVSIEQGADNLHRVIVGPLAAHQVSAFQKRLENAGLNGGYILRQP
jgi:rare lipoprotein A